MHMNQGRPELLRSQDPAVQRLPDEGKEDEGRRGRHFWNLRFLATCWLPAPFRSPEEGPTPPVLLRRSHVEHSTSVALNGRRRPSRGRRQPGERRRCQEKRQGRTKLPPRSLS